MTGIIIITHSNLGAALIQTAEAILQEKLTNTISISIDLKEDVEILKNKISEGIKKVNKNNKVIILTDMFGGTPANLSYAFLKENEIEVLSGVNLPMLLKAISMQKKENINLKEIVQILEEQGKKGISIASNILNG